MSWLNAMRRLVNLVLECKCAQLHDCGRLAAFVMESAGREVFDEAICPAG